MERRALSSSVGVFAVALTAMPVLCPAAAQRLEVAVFAGGSQAIPSSWESEANYAACNPVVAPCQTRVTRHAGSLIGARFAVDVSQRVAFAWTVHVARATTLVELNDGTGALQATTQEVTDLVLALQPIVRFPIRKSFELLAGAGPAFSVLESHTRVGLAFSGGASLRMGSAFKAQFQAGYATYLPRKDVEVVYSVPPAESSPESLNDVTWSFGLAYGFGARSR